MATLREAIEAKVKGLRELVEKSRALVRGEQSRQESIFQAITVENGRLVTLGAYLDEEVDAAKENVAAMLEAYSAGLPKK